jgi:hypothetical protein
LLSKDQPPHSLVATISYSGGWSHCWTHPEIECPFCNRKHYQTCLEGHIHLKQTPQLLEAIRWAHSLCIFTITPTLICANATVLVLASQVSHPASLHNLWRLNLLLGKLFAGLLASQARLEGVVLLHAPDSIVPGLLHTAPLICSWALPVLLAQTLLTGLWQPLIQSCHWIPRGDTLVLIQRSPW